MGIENRDYYRGSRSNVGRPSGFSEIPIVCKRLLIANVVIFILQIAIVRSPSVSDFAALGNDASSPTEIQPDTSNDGEIAQKEPSVPMEQMTEEERRRFFQKLNEELRQHDVYLFDHKISIVQSWGELDPAKVAKGQVWRLVTCAFLHDRYGVWHILFNMLFLFWFGTRLEHMYGAREFAFFYFAAAIFSSLAFLAIAFYTNNMIPAIGASGAVMAVVVLYAIHHPYETIRIYFLFPIQLRWLALIYLIFDLHPVLLELAGDGHPDGVAHSAHLGGALFGFLYFKLDWRLDRLWDRLPADGQQRKWQTHRTKGKPARDTIRMFASDEDPQIDEPVDPREKRMEIDLDRVLEKISKEGRESLTDEEIEVLETASQKYRAR